MTESLNSTIDLVLGNTPIIRDASPEEIYEALLKVHQAIEILVNSYDSEGNAYVTIGTTQTITAAKTFSNSINFTGTVTGLTFTKSFTSTEQVISSAGTFTLAHALGISPELIQVRLVCKTAELGYLVNDEVIINPAGNDPGSAGSRGLSITSNATNIIIRYGANATPITIISKDTGTASTITNASWRLIVKAWA